LLLESDNFITATADFAKQMIGCVEDGMFTARKLEGAGHWLMLERPVVVNQMLDEFLA
jgi:pimeloyl-ACP methyl ester carboxylesterase